MLKTGRLGVEIRPQVILQILANLENHHPVQRHWLSTISLHQELRLVNLLHKLRTERLLRLRIGGFEPAFGGDFGEAVALDLVESNGVRSAGEGDRFRRLVERDLGGSVDGVLRDAVALEVVDAGAIDLGHGGGDGGAQGFCNRV